MGSYEVSAGFREDSWFFNGIPAEFHETPMGSRTVWWSFIECNEFPVKFHEVSMGSHWFATGSPSNSMGSQWKSVKCDDSAMKLHGIWIEFHETSMGGPVGSPAVGSEPGQDAVLLRFIKAFGLWAGRRILWKFHETSMGIHGISKNSDEIPLDLNDVLWISMNFQSDFVKRLWNSMECHEVSL